MRRLLFAVGLLATIAISEADGGYLIVRVIVEGGGGAGEGGVPGMPGMPAGGEGFNLRPAPAPFRPVDPMTPGMPPGSGGPATISGHDPTRSVFAVVPFTKKWEKRPFYYKRSWHFYQNPYWDVALTHPFGATNLFLDNVQIQWYRDFGQDPATTRTRQSQVHAKHEAWTKKPAGAQQLLEIMTEALDNGMVDEAVKCADEMLEAVQKKKVPTSPQVDKFVQAYEQVQKPMKEPARQPVNSQMWKNALAILYGEVNDQIRGHYCLLYWDAPEPERTRRLAQLEGNFQAFVLLHAVRGVVLPIPDRPLVAILAKSGDDTLRLSASLDALPRVADAAYVPEYDVVVLSPERLDDVGRTFHRQIQQVYRGGASRAVLLDAGVTGPRLDTSGTVKDTKKPEEVARMMTWAMVERYAEEEFEWSAVSLEATRQLMYATGVLPRHVALPTWAAEGSVACFHRPKGPVYTFKGEEQKAHATLALTTGYGPPNYVRQKQFRELVEHKQLGTDPGKMLRNVVTDAYFAAARDGIDADDPKLPLPIRKKVAAPAAGTLPATPEGMPPAAPPGTTPGVAPGTLQVEDPATYQRRKREFLVNKAYATAWALYFYLAQHDPEGLKRYVAELDKLPRDLPLDEPTRLALFVKAFNLTTAATTEAGKTTFADLARGWLRTLETLPPVGVEIELETPEPPKDGMNPTGMPMPPIPGTP